MLIPVKYQAYGINVTEIIPKSSWHTHLKHYKPYMFILQKLKKPQNGLCTNLFFDSEIILIFGGLFLYILSRLLKLKLNWLRVITTDFTRQKHRTRRENPNSSKLSWKARKKPPKANTKNRPFFMHNIKGYDLSHTLFKIVITRTSWI